MKTFSFFFLFSFILLASCKKDKGPTSNPTGGGQEFTLDDNSFVKGSSGGSMNVAAIQTDGKILASGGSYLYRFTTDGQPDHSFEPPDFITPGDLAFAIAIQNDQKILVGGTFQSLQAWHIVRLNADGSMDQSFKPYLISTSAGSVTPNVNCFDIQPDGKVIVGGSFNYFVNGVQFSALMRLNADGSVDETFAPPLNAYSDVRRLAVGSDGKLIAAGSLIAQDGTTFRNYLVKFNADGSIDNSFNFSDTAINYPLAIVTDFAFLPDGKIMIGGSELNSEDNTSLTSVSVERLNANGTVDPSFVNDVVGSRNTPVTSILSVADGGLLVGQAFTLGFPPEQYLVLLDKTGQADTDFKLGLDENGINQMIRETDDKILLVGGFYNGSTAYGLVHLIQR